MLFAFINLVMKLAPIGTFGAVAYSVGSNGGAVLLALAQLVLGFMRWSVGHRAGARHDRQAGGLQPVALPPASSRTRSSSCWARPRRRARCRLLIKLERLGCAKQTVGLVLPTGYAFNLDGTSLFMAMGVMFISHAHGVPLSLDAQPGILLLMLLTSKGAATVSAVPSSCSPQR